MQEQFARIAMLLGEDSVEKLATKKVAVLGVGGVGSFVVEALARGGIGGFFLADHDTVDITNLNRQLQATLDTVGKYKTKLLQERILSINAKALVRTSEEFILPENIQSVLPNDLDYIVDALDTVTTKLAIAEYAYQRGIPVVSSMGTGNKLDPFAFRIADINQTSVCPLAKVVRQELRKRKIPKLKVLFSTEQPLAPQADPFSSPKEPEHRRLTPGSVSFVPPVAGMLIGGQVIKDLLEL